MGQARVQVERRLIQPAGVDEEQVRIAGGPEGFYRQAPGLCAGRWKDRRDGLRKRLRLARSGPESAKDGQLAHRVNVAIQLGSQVRPGSSEKACSSRNDRAVMSEKMKR